METEEVLIRSAVLGTGFSLGEFRNEGYDIVIGVNDIWKFVKTDAIVCLDRTSAFTHERLRIINESKPKAFFSQIVMWDTRPDFQKIELQMGYPDRICDLDNKALPKSYCSPFVATALAYKYYHATEIHLFGVDLINHPHLKGKVAEGIVRHFKNLKFSLEAKKCKLIVHGNGILAEL